MILFRRRRFIWLLAVVMIASLSGCTSQCVPCRGLEQGTAVERVAFVLCASEEPEAGLDESVCVDISLAYSVMGE